MFKFYYLNIKGRCSIKIYWLVGVLPFFTIGLILGLITEAINLPVEVIFITTLIMIWPILAMQIKRLNDIGISGWLCLISFIPYLGTIFALVIGFIPGKDKVDKIQTES